MTCAVCQQEPHVGWITVPMGDGTDRFPIGERCYRLQKGALKGEVWIADFATICSFQPVGEAAEEWLRALLDEMRPLVSRQVRWEARMVN